MRKELKDMSVLHPETVEQLQSVLSYYPFDWKGEKLRCVPLKEGTSVPCQSCTFSKQRNTHVVCPMIKACMGHLRVDRKSVKFISDELSSLNMSEEDKIMAQEADRECYKRRGGHVIG